MFRASDARNKSRLGEQLWKGRSKKDTVPSHYDSAKRAQAQQALDALNNNKFDIAKGCFFKLIKL